MEEKKSKKVDSPEQLNEYIRLSNPGVWITMIAIIVLLIGFCVWGVFGKIDTKIATVAVSDEASTYIYVKEEDLSKVKDRMPVTLNGSEDTFEIVELYETPEKITEDMDEYVRHLGDLQIGEWAYKCKLDKNVKEGTYGADIIIESISPMKFIVN